MKTIGIAAGALVCAAAAPAFAQGNVQPPPGATMSPPPGASTQPPALVVVPPGATTPGVVTEARDVLTAPVRAPSKAFEIGADAGYTQGFGSVSAGRGVGDVAGAGGALGLSLGYRIDPHWSLAATGRLQGYGAGNTMPDGTKVRGATAGVEGTLHIKPYDRLDPFVSLGTGYRALFESPAGNAPTTITHGLELGRLEVGLDVRPSESVAIAPVIGADLNMFMWRTGGGAETAPLTSRSLNTFVFAGIKGRFDLGGTRESQPATQVGQR